MERLYFITTADELEWPIAVADSLEELAKVYGKSRDALYHNLWRQRAGRKLRDYKVEVVEVEESNSEID